MFLKGGDGKDNLVQIFFQGFVCLRNAWGIHRQAQKYVLIKMKEE